jgi:uncharacterized RDD family membrane protein YckC
MEDTENKAVYAGFWLRFCATVIDNILIVLLTCMPVSIIYGFDKYINNDSLYLGPWHFLIEFVIPVMLIIWLWVRFSATPGKMLLRLKVVDIKTLQPISFRQAIIRYFGYVPSIFCFLIWIIWIAFDNRKQGWHDKLASMAVIRVTK